MELRVINMTWEDIIKNEVRQGPSESEEMYREKREKTQDKLSTNTSRLIARLREHVDELEITGHDKQPINVILDNLAELMEAHADYIEPPSTDYDTNHERRKATTRAGEYLTGLAQKNRETAETIRGKKQG
tara:strand:- start:129 stop:521 length:393 start_codon:yes stop_codon:yes gene_type:complete